MKILSQKDKTVDLLTHKTEKYKLKIYQLKANISNLNK